ncbi:MAG: hypothetical protein GXP36_11605 [Actinobacteria bacterium]|nr:hypothetical protein [Actinomycetota bacterium]
MTEQLRGHVFPKWGPRGPFRVYSWLQASVTGLGLVLGALMLVAGMAGPAVILVLMLGALALRDPTGMPVWNRVGLGLRYLAGRVRAVRRRDSAGPHIGLLAGVELSGFHLPQGVMGVVADRGRFLAAMRVSPTRDPWLQSRADRDVAADDWARVVTSLPVEYVDRLQVLTISRQGGGDDLISDAATAKGPGLEVLKDVACHLAAHVRHTETVLVVRLSSKASRDAMRRGGDEAVGRLLHSTLQHLGAQFPTEQLQGEILAPADWSALFSSVLLPTRHADQHGLDPGRLPEPSNVDERWGTISVDDHLHRLLWMWQWPLRPMGAGFLAPLLTGGGNRVVSLTVAPKDPEPHHRSLDFAFRRAEAAVETARGGKHRKKSELDSLDRQLKELNEGHVPIHALVTVAVSGTDEDEIEDLAGTVRSNAVAGSSRLAVLGGNQRRALGWVLPLCRGLDKGLDG